MLKHNCYLCFNESFSAQCMSYSVPGDRGKTSSVLSGPLNVENDTNLQTFFSETKATVMFVRSEVKSN